VSFAFTNRTIDDRSILEHEMNNLTALVDKEAWITFESTIFKLLEIKEITRRVTIDEWGNILVQDLYHIINKGERKLYTVTIRLPRNASSISATDPYGSLKTTIKNQVNYVDVEVPLRDALKRNERIRILISYKLPQEIYIHQEGWESYRIIMNPVTYTNRWIIGKMNLILVLPEGSIYDGSVEKPSGIEREPLREIITFIRYNLTKFQKLNVNLLYRYNIFWASFRPTLWAGILATVVCTVLYYFRRVPQPVVVGIPIPVETIRRFIENYEERRRILLELESMRRRVRRGRISRRQYRVRRNKLNARLSKIQADLNKLREELESVSGRYAELIRELEISEAELDSINMDIERLQARYRRREISLEAYRRLMEEYDRRKERAESTIDEILLRFREEIH